MAALGVLFDVVMTCLFHCRAMVPCGRVVEVPMLCVLSISLVKQQLVV